MTPDAEPVNTDEALELLRDGSLRDFHLRLTPGDDHYFYLALADRPVEDLFDKPFFGRGLIGIDQPDVEYVDDAENTGT